jgi:hypothetical protein
MYPMGWLEGASLQEILGTKCAACDRSGRRIALSTSLGERASSENWRCFVDGKGVRMRFLPTLFFGRDALLLEEA